MGAAAYPRMLTLFDDHQSEGHAALKETVLEACAELDAEVSVHGRSQLHNDLYMMMMMMMNRIPHRVLPCSDRVGGWGVGLEQIGGVVGRNVVVSTMNMGLKTMSTWEKNQAKNLFQVQPPPPLLPSATRPAGS